jgi:hypothetical protein
MTSRAWPLSRYGGASALALALVLVSAAGCDDDSTGSGASALTSPADDFVGTWLYGDFQSFLQCPGAEPASQPPQPNKTFARGTTSALVDLSPSPLLPGVFCDITFDVAGPVATAQPNQTCALTALDNLTIDQPMGTSLWTFTLNSATTAEEIVQATAHFQINGQLSSCSWNMAAHLTRISKD